MALKRTGRNSPLKACWDGYEMRGMKKKGSRSVPNCVPKNSPAKKAEPSKLKPGSKDAKRRKSFCARSKGWTGERGKAARRRWNC